MKYKSGNRYHDVMTDNFGGPRWTREKHDVKYMRVLPLIWRLIKIFCCYGNKTVYYHLCGDHSCYDIPMEAENVEVRLSNCGPKVTIW